jgi:hypothetical protein
MHPKSEAVFEPEVIVVAVREYVYLIPRIEEPDYLFLKGRKEKT